MTISTAVVGQGTRFAGIRRNPENARIAVNSHAQIP
jgi:hypothetical protein